MQIPTIQGFDSVPDFAPPSVILSFPPRVDDAHYLARTDRNIGWILAEEQQLLRECVISIAGTGGMGGQVAQLLVRTGVGTIRIADPEVFDPSNINRQLAANRHTIGKSKALETARILRSIADDYRLEVYPQGICLEILPHFVPHADLIVDEIEFWNIGSCILMHQMARQLGIPIINCLTVGFATYLHYFTPESMPVEEMLGISLSEALELEAGHLAGTLSDATRHSLMDTIFRCFIPHMPAYYAGPEGPARNQWILDRLAHTGEASILGANASIAAGFVAVRTLLAVLAQRKGAARSVTPLPVTPDYVCFDAAVLPETTIRRRAYEEFSHGY